MALHTITPAESVLAQFSSEEASRIGASAISNFSKLEADNHSLFHYNLPAYAKSKLSERGFYLSPFSYETHSHPVSKTIESHLINIKLPNYINESFLIVGIKDSKLSVLRKDKKLRFLEALNRCVTSHDIQRYGPSFHFERARANWRRDFSEKDLSKGVESLLPRVLFDKGRTKDAQLFLYDELHYWSMKDIVDFLEITNAQTIIGSFVFPTEILAGVRNSLNPWAYDFKIKGDKLIYAPDGVWSESYEQPLASGQLLKYNKIKTRVGDYSVQVRDQIFSHCLVIINRDSLVNEEYRVFSDFDAVSISLISFMGGNADEVIPVRQEVILAVFKYIRTLKKPDLQSGMAKHRQLVDNPSGFEVRFIEDFVHFILEHNEQFNLIEQSFKNFLSAACVEKMPKFLRRLFSKFKGHSLGKFIEELQAFNFTIRCQHYSRFGFKNTYAEEEEEELNKNDPMISTLKKSSLGQLNVDTVAYPCLVYDGCCCVFTGIHVNLIGHFVKSFINAWVGCSNLGYYEALIALAASIHQRGKKLFLLHDEKFMKLAILANLVNSLAFKMALKVEVTRRLRRRNAIRGLLRFDRLSEHPEDKRERAVTLNFSRVVSEVLELATECPVTSILAETHYITKLMGFRSNGNVAVGASEEGGSVQELKIPFHPENLQTGEICVDEKVKGERAPEVTKEEPPIGPDENLHSRFISSIIKVGEFKDNAIRKFASDLTFENGYKHKGRTALFFSRGSFSYGFNSVTYPSQGWPAEFEEAYGSRFNSCLVQIYEFGSKLGFHSDDESCYDDDLEVLTVNLFGEACIAFRRVDNVEVLKEQVNETSQGPENYVEVKLSDGEFLLMPKGFQQGFQHSVKYASNNRVSLTFRLQSRDLNGKPIQCGPIQDSAKKKGVEEQYYEVMNGCSISKSKPGDICSLSVFPVKADGDCFWHAVSSIFGLEAMELKSLVHERALSEKCIDKICEKDFKEEMQPKVYASNASVTATCFLMNIKLIIKLVGADDEGFVTVEPLTESKDKISIGYLILNQRCHHFDLAVPKEGCVIRAVSEFLKQNPTKILSVLSANCSKELLAELMSGLGIQEFHLEEIFRVFDIKAEVCDGSELRIINKKGSREARFAVENDHFSYCPGVKAATNLGAFRQPHGNSIIPEDRYNDFLKSNANIVPFTPSLSIAKTLANSFLSGQTGVINSRIVAGQFDWLADTNKLCFDERKIGVMVGTFGSGKSHSVVELLKANLNYQNIIISPRRSLKDQFIGMLDLVSKRKKGKKISTEVATFEVALKKNGVLKKTRIFMDETQLLPPGYLDLICLVAGRDSSILVMGDPAQSSYDSAEDRMVFVGSEGNLDRLLKEKRYVYLSESRRFRNPMFVGRLPCTFDAGRLTLEKEEYAVFDNFKDFKADYLSPKIGAFLVSSFTEKTVVKANMGRNVDVYTFGESTGMNFDYVCVLLTQDSMLVDERRWVVALSRARINISFVNLSGLSLQEFCSQMVGGIIHKFFTSTANYNDLRALLPGDPMFSKKFMRLGSDEVDREARLAGDPWLKTKIFLGQRIARPEEIEVDDCNPPDLKIKVHCPVGSMGSTFAEVQSRVRAKENREHRIDSLITDQFAECHKGRGKILTASPDNFEAIYPRHKAGDTATFVMAARKRLKFSIPAKEGQKFKAAIPYGESMLQIFLKRVKVQPNFDHKLFSEAVSDFEEKKLTKSMATLENHSGRSDPDWENEKALIFMKSQLCTKFDNRFRAAKAGQTLACFHHNVLCRLAPYIRYIEKKVFSHLPDNYYIHSGKNFDELRSWVLRNSFTGMCTESDYEAFDSSQDANILAFEVSLMRYLRLPRDLIEDYKYLKFNTRSKLGQFAVMRFTGEAGTFLFNTLANMVFTFMRYDINGKESICFAGDDMCANKRLRKKSEFEHILDRMTLKAKVQYTTEPTFCGWRLGDFGIVKRPQLVQERILIALEKGNFHECIDNYAIEVSYAYNLGERLISIMSEKELDAHYFCVRTFLQNKCLFHSNAIKFFKEGEGCISPDRNFS
ncbi:RNA-dependent RNA polymerase [Cherry green ring mottle virus]|uniref:RNA-dependent RNA polymerase n=1 Tax=Cherry green ring mottle virus TaxID=65467 RepID=O91632_9VIRU|nr:RNA-dependent RNA polymerase [Cherry green ring mottle virus]AAC35433.1 RNA-dependent RNA polymerase [Cherry green ring mottle virus]